MLHQFNNTKTIIQWQSNVGITLVLHENMIIIISLMTQIYDNIGSKYNINNNMVSVIFKYFINNITKGLIPIINVYVRFIHQISNLFCKSRSSIVKGV